MRVCVLVYVREMERVREGGELESCVFVDQ